MKKLIVAALVLAMVSSAYAVPSTVGMELWLKADAGITMDKKDVLVVSWADQSGQGNDFVAGSKQEPGFTSSWGPLSQPSVVFALDADGTPATEDFMEGPEFMDFSDWTIFAVFQGMTSNSAWGGSIFADYGATTNDRVKLGLSSGSGNPGNTVGWDVHARSSAGVPAQVNLYIGYPTPAGDNDNEPEILTGALDSTAQTLYGWSKSDGFLGSDTDTDWVATTTTGTVGPPTIGTNSGAGAGGIKGYLAEVIIYNSKLNDTDRVAVENYLYGKYIPEPATIALLGLGGLVLIRKRR